MFAVQECIFEIVVSRSVLQQCCVVQCNVFGIFYFTAMQVMLWHNVMRCNVQCILTIAVQCSMKKYWAVCFSAVQCKSFCFSALQFSAINFCVM